MRFRSSSKSVIPNWRWVLWAASLVPALMVLGWSAQQATQPRPDVAAEGRTPEEAQRLRRVLNEPHHESTTPLRDDAVRVLPVADADPQNQVSSSEMLSSVTDNAFGIPAAEKPAYDRLLKVVRETPPEELQNLVDKEVPFAVLMLDPDRFRGKVLSVVGEVRRLNRLAATTDDTHNDETFEAWLFTPDSGLNPYRIVFSHFPDGMPVGDQLTPPIRVCATGYFFKRYSYATANDFHTAPLLLARTLEPLVAQQTKEQTPPSRRSQTLTVVSIGILVIFAVFVLAMVLLTRRPQNTNRVSADSEEPDFTDF